MIFLLYPALIVYIPNIQRKMKYSAVISNDQAHINLALTLNCHLCCHKEAGDKCAINYILIDLKPE